MPQLISELNSEYGYVENRISDINPIEQTISFLPYGGFWHNGSSQHFAVRVRSSITYDIFGLNGNQFLNKDTPEENASDKIIRRCLLTYKDSNGIQQKSGKIVNNTWWRNPKDDLDTWYFEVMLDDGIIPASSDKMLNLEVYYNILTGMLLWRQEQGELDYGTNIASLGPDNNYTYKDNSIEQGVQYLYGVSAESEADSDSFVVDTADNIIDSDFEDIFLSDSERSLRIRFNPKVSSFKTVFQEQKVDTIGGRFPFFVRNGNLKYRELSLSGLISYEMDDYFLFNSNTSTSRTSTPGGDFTPMTSREKFYQERKFKLAVEEWLTNGKPKIFRSAAEGNYIIRLMNVSLSPEDKLSRMLHTFSATGYEVDAYTYENLVKWNLRTNDVPQINIVTNIATNTTYGIVKGSLLENHISINPDGTMQVNSINLDKLTQTNGDYLILGDV